MELILGALSLGLGLIWLALGVGALLLLIKKGYLAIGCLFLLIFGWNLIPLIIAAGPVSWLIVRILPPWSTAVS